METIPDDVVLDGVRAESIVHIHTWHVDSEEDEDGREPGEAND